MDVKHERKTNLTDDKFNWNLNKKGKSLMALIRKRFEQVTLTRGPLAIYWFWKANFDLKIVFEIQSNSVITNGSGPDKFVRYNRGSL